MLILSASEVFSNIVDGLLNIWVQVQNMEWSTIFADVKNWVVGGGMVVFVAKVLPFLKNSNKPILTKLGEIAEKLLIANAKIDSLELENLSLKDGLKATVNYLETTAQVNLSSKVLSAEQKALFQNAVFALQAVGTELTTHVASEVQTVVADGVITADEVITLAEHAPVIEKALGTPISDLMPKV